MCINITTGINISYCIVELHAYFTVGMCFYPDILNVTFYTAPLYI